MPERAIKASASTLSGIYRLATTKAAADVKGENPDASMGSVAKGAYVGAEDHAKVMEALKHFVGNWRERGGDLRRLDWCSVRWGSREGGQRGEREGGFGSRNWLGRLALKALWRLRNSDRPSVLRSPIVNLSR
jgi:hypothetical protein